MKPSEATVILTKIAAYDRRTIGEADAEAWSEALDGLVTLQDAMTAVRDHFRESDQWLMPKEIIERSKKIRVDRVRKAGVPDMPPDLTQQQERAWVREFYDQLASTDDVALAQHFADRHVGVTRVEGIPADPNRVKVMMEGFAESFSLPRSGHVS